MGMVLIAWGVLLLLGGLIMATRGGGWYYAGCGLGSAAHFSRSYHGWAGKAPSAERRRPALGIMPVLR